MYLEFSHFIWNLIIVCLKFKSQMFKLWTTRLDNNLRTLMVLCEERRIKERSLWALESFWVGSEKAEGIWKFPKFLFYCNLCCLICVSAKKSQSVQSWFAYSRSLNLAKSAWATDFFKKTALWGTFEAQVHIEGMWISKFCFQIWIASTWIYNTALEK